MIAPKSSARRVGERRPRPNYDLRASQIETPLNIVKLYWTIIHKHRPKLGSVLDMGAGDGRFSKHGNYTSYTGVELDASRTSASRLSRRATIVEGCVFAQPRGAFDACIGNPPYLRHHDIESPWKEVTLSRLSTELETSLSGHSNLFLYFMALGLIRTAASGITALLVPFDWVSRPAARGLRAVIKKKRWDVSVYRFSFPVFDGVETTASISVIDKRGTQGRWAYYDISKEFSIAERTGMTGTGRSLLRYARRGKLFARRGLSPGSQQVFTLTEAERVHHGLTRHDVLPCITTLRGVSAEVVVLDQEAFQQHFVRAGRRCWLIRSRDDLSDRLAAYVGGVRASQRDSATCRHQVPWYNYEEVKPPNLLLHSGFTRSGPRVIVNKLRAIPVGSMYGIYGCPKGHEADVQGRIASRRILAGVVPHSGRLRKIEVGQLNGILARIAGSIDD